MNCVARFDAWVSSREGLLELSYEELCEVNDQLNHIIDQDVAHTIRVHEKYGPYLTRAYVMNCFDRGVGITLAIWERTAHE